MTLTREEREKIEEEERVRAEARTKYSKPQEVRIKKKTSLATWGCLILLVPILIAYIISSINTSSDKTKSTEENKGNITSTVGTNVQEKEVFNKTKAGQICLKHPSWTKEDCIGIADKKIWVGMSYEMLIYLRGKPNSANPSNYGGATHWQWCWNNYTPSCFYDNNDDQIIDSYN